MPFWQLDFACIRRPSEGSYVSESLVRRFGRLKEAA